MESPGLQSGDCNPPSGWRKKGRAPPPPPPNQSPAAYKENNEKELTKDLEIFSDQCVINMKENLINRTVDVTVVFPDGEEQKHTLHGSKAVMDLLVDLCNEFHLNPDHHTLELQSLDAQQTLNYKPNTLIGGLDVWKILLKKKNSEEKTKRLSPKITEKTTRLVVNYLKTQKAVIQVNPEVPLRSIIPAICEKCEVSQEHLVLLRDTFTGEELELTKSLNELGIKELYAWDRQRELRSCDVTEKEKRRFLGFFRTNKRISKGITTAPNSPSVNSCPITLGPSLSLGSISGTAPSTEVKKRRAPPPPVMISQYQSAEATEQEKTLGEQMSQSSSQNELQKKKRRAPPPPTPTIPSRTEEMEDKRKSTVVYCCASFPTRTKRV
uniref:Cordon-bleu WH2 repeat protein n=1 Tax=Salvator merianae TaxID=96440 RepID=A0A8D0DPF1_SALMN